MTCVPNDQIELVAGFPPISRTFGSSIAYVVSSCINELCGDLILGIRINGILHVLMAFTMMNLAAFRLGNSEIERGKRYFAEKRIRVRKTVNIEMKNVTDDGD